MNGTDRFDRYELKYWIGAALRDRLHAYLLDFMEIDPFVRFGDGYRVTSLYFDTPGRRAYLEKVNGDFQRGKHRIRFYDEDPSTLFLEYKRKSGNFVRKERTRRDVGSAGFDAVERLLDVDPSDFAAEVRGMRPVCWVGYRRTPLVGRDNPLLRVTFDEELRGAAADGFAYAPGRLEPVPGPYPGREVILEIKFNRLFPRWLHNAVLDFELRQESISKFGMTVERCVREEAGSWIR